MIRSWLIEDISLGKEPRPIPVEGLTEETYTDLVNNFTVGLTIAPVITTDKYQYITDSVLPDEESITHDDEAWTCHCTDDRSSYFAGQWSEQEKRLCTVASGNCDCVGHFGKLRLQSS